MPTTHIIERVTKYVELHCDCGEKMQATGLRISDYCDLNESYEYYCPACGRHCFRDRKYPREVKG